MIRIIVLFKNFIRESFIKYTDDFFTKNSKNLKSKNTSDIIFDSLKFLKKSYFGPDTSKITKILNKYYFFIFKYLT